MPNNTSNTLQFYGDTADVNEVYGLLSNNGKDGVLLFNNSVPMPEELRNTMKRWDANETDEEKAERIRIGEELKAKYGVDNWYDWSCENWGTKWDAYDVGEWDVDEGGGGTWFNTAWSPPVPWLKATSAKFPRVTFEMSYTDEACCYCGRVKFKGGVLLEEYNPEPYSKAGIELRGDMGTYNEGDDYEIRGRYEYLCEHPEDGSREEFEEYEEKYNNLDD